MLRISNKLIFSVDDPNPNWRVHAYEQNLKIRGSCLEVDEGINHLG